MAEPNSGSHSGRADVTLRAGDAASAGDAPPSGRPDNVKDFLSHLKASGVMSADAFRNVVGALQPEHFQQSVREFADELVRHRRLTPFQASVLSEGGRLFYGPYVLLDRLGEGGVATVCLGRHRESGQTYAIKIVPRNDERFDREVRAAARIPEHPNVVSVIDRAADQGVEFLVMEHVEGPNLADYITRNQPLSVRRAIELLLQCAQGVSHMHAQRVIHRDIKPENFVVGENGNVKLIDLGLARFDLGPSSFGSGERLTVEGSTLGTPCYMAPEQIRDPRQADYRSDVYSLGCVLYHLLTGLRPFAKPNPYDTMQAQLVEPIPSLAEKRRDIPPALEKLFEKLLAKDPAGRPQTVDEVIAALKAILVEAPAAAAAGPAKVSGVGLAVLAIGALTVLGVILWLTGVFG